MNKSELQAFVRRIVLEELTKEERETGPAPAPPSFHGSGKGGSDGALSLTPLDPTGKWETGNLAQDAQKVLQVNADKLTRKGVNTKALKQLGVGTMGVAYDMGGNKVLKVTKDAKEAKTSSIVAGKNLPNIVHVYDIWKFPDVDWYGLIIEKLSPLSSEEAEQLTQAVINTKFPMFLHQAGDDWNKAMQMLAQESTRSLVSQAYQQFPNANPTNGGQGVNDPQVQQFVRSGAQKVVLDFDRVTKEYKMRSLFKSLKALGIRYYDFHGGNYGRREDGTLVLFDLGRSISPGEMPPELQEAFNRCVIRRLG